MTSFDSLFLACFILLGILMLLLGVVSFLFNHQKYVRIKSKVNNKTLSASKELTQSINSTFWVYIVVLNSKIGEEINNISRKNQAIKESDQRSIFFLELQILFLILSFVLFVTYIGIKILSNWILNWF